MLLTSLIALPLLLSLLTLIIPTKWVRSFALGGALVEFALSLVILARFDSSLASLQLVENYQWLPEFGIRYFLGVDGISLWLVILTTFLAPLVILGSWTAITERIKTFHICLFMLQTSMLGTFLAIDSILFYVFWELSLIPMYFLIGIWGGSRRLYATIKFFIFTMAGSVLMLIAIIYLMLLTQATLGEMSASLLDFYRLRVSFVGGELLNPQTLLFFAFVLAFAIKVPMFPFHTWLPDAHVEAPTPGSVILAGVMLKMGTYGFMRFVIPLFPEATEYWAWLFMSLGVIGIIYGALVAMVQPDIKKLVAYSSVSHMGYIVMGLFALNVYGLTGGLYQMLNHGISTGALFFLVGMIYERTHSREIKRYGGLAMALPIFTICFVIITMSSIAVPVTNGFVGEFFILMGTYLASPYYAAAGVLGVILGAAYMLWLVKRVFYGEPGELVAPSLEVGEASSGSKLKDMNWRELTVIAPLIVLVFWMGIFPQHFLRWSEASLNHLAENRFNYVLTVNERELSAGSIAELDKE